jgi:hypothetical protein
MDEMQEKTLRKDSLELMLKAIQAAPDAFYKLKSASGASFAEEVIKGAEAFQKYLSA